MHFLHWGTSTEAGRFVLFPTKLGRESEKRLRPNPRTDSFKVDSRTLGEIYLFTPLLKGMQLGGEGGGEIKRQPCHNPDGSGRKVTVTLRNHYAWKNTALAFFYSGLKKVGSTYVGLK
ncbi:hypothetical protein NPIL_268821 [Nephila pilipes]|uniref:Uncharacterized protein n=1 Tax=Nephila pilipes TaxID=299642 RepID=A0A8X6NK11_NEPPI|nr:hypothetical protein NPIL_268821 [Nephila pilipes]